MCLCASLSLKLKTFQLERAAQDVKSHDTRLSHDIPQSRWLHWIEGGEEMETAELALLVVVKQDL